MRVDRPWKWLVVVMVGTVTVAARGEEFRLLAWNVESNRPKSRPVSDARAIAAELTALMKDAATRAPIVALSEVEPRNAIPYRQAIAAGLGTDVDFVTSASGGFQDTDSLMLVVDRKRFAIEEAVEIHRYGGITANFNVETPESDEFGTVRARSPLLVRLRDRISDRTFHLFVLHLARGEADLRTDQARVLRRWAEDHRDEPVIAAGDFNFDYEFRTSRGNAAYDAMIEGGVWEWLKPDPLIDSNWTDDRTNPGRDLYPGSILDFVFVANGARQWRGESDVVVRPGDFPDTDRTSDHRPIIATFRP
jgi:endonuclease/exonuclease/phosphatase family metal-dependent hydrolase